jgi:hypothetical protein
MDWILSYDGERLPEEGKEVVLHTLNGENIVGYYDCDEAVFTVINDTMDYQIWHTVTHWLEIPECI